MMYNNFWHLYEDFEARILWQNLYFLYKRVHFDGKGNLILEISWLKQNK